MREKILYLFGIMILTGVLAACGTEEGNGYTGEKNMEKTEQKSDKDDQKKDDQDSKEGDRDSDKKVDREKESNKQEKEEADIGFGDEEAFEDDEMDMWDDEEMFERDDEEPEQVSEDEYLMTMSLYLDDLGDYFFKISDYADTMENDPEQADVDFLNEVDEEMEYLGYLLDAFDSYIAPDSLEEYGNEIDTVVEHTRFIQENFVEAVETGDHELVEKIGDHSVQAGEHLERANDIID